MEEQKQQNQQNQQKIIITSALPYVNNVPHLGNIVGCVLSADVYARFLRANNESNADIVFIGGVDEYGTATEMKARELGITCKELCDQNYDLHKKIYDWFNISFDCYGRTSQPNGTPDVIDKSWPQTQITHEIFDSLCKNGYIFEKEERVMHCPSINAFVADRFVVGGCRFCGSKKADGDQCDQCGKLLTIDDIVNPKYKPDPKYALEIRTTTNLYLDTDKIWQNKNMKKWFDNTNKLWTISAMATTREWTKANLKPLSITRDLQWGTRVPDTDQFGSKYNNKVFYVWFDAPIGYISISENCLGKERSEDLWKDPNTKLVHFMAKDNTLFHSIIFPATLHGSEYANINCVDIAATEYLTYEEQKFSKSKNTGLFCDDVMTISEKYNLDSDLWRAYLIYIRPETSDSNFVLNEQGGFVDFVNNIIIKNIVNLMYRVLCVAFQIHNEYNIDTLSLDIDTLETIKTNDINFKDLENDITTIMTDYANSMKKYKLIDGLKTALLLGSKLNKYIVITEPWTLIKKNDQKDQLFAVMIELFTNINKLSQLIDPFMPHFGQKIRDSFIIKEFGVLALPLVKPPSILKPIPILL